MAEPTKKQQVAVPVYRGKVWLKDPVAGDLIPFAPSSDKLTQAFADGYTPASTLEIEKKGKQEFFGSGLGKAVSALSGAVQGFIPGSGALLKSDPNDQFTQLVKGAQEVNPGYKMGGELAGFAGSALSPNAPLSLVSKLGATATKGIGNALVKTVAKGAIEGTGFGLAEGVNEITDKEIKDSKQALKILLKSGGSGAVFGGALNSGGFLLGRGYTAAKTALINRKNPIKVAYSESKKLRSQITIAEKELNAAKQSGESASTVATLEAKYNTLNSDYINKQQEMFDLAMGRVALGGAASVMGSNDDGTSLLYGGLGLIAGPKTVGKVLKWVPGYKNITKPLAKVSGAALPYLEAASKVAKDKLNQQTAKVLSYLDTLTPAVKAETNALEGMSFAISGQVSAGKKGIREIVDSFGGVASAKRLTKNTNYLIVADKAKLTKQVKDAQKWGVRVIDENEFAQMANQTQAKLPSWFHGKYGLTPKSKALGMADDIANSAEQASFDGSEVAFRGSFKTNPTDLKDFLQDLGGIPAKRVTGKTKFLVVPDERLAQIEAKISKAGEQAIAAKNKNATVIGESDFLKRMAQTGKAPLEFYESTGIRPPKQLLSEFYGAGGSNTELGGLLGQHMDDWLKQPMEALTGPTVDIAGAATRKGANVIRSLVPGPMGSVLGKGVELFNESFGPATAKAMSGLLDASRVGAIQALSKQDWSEFSDSVNDLDPSMARVWINNNMPSGVEDKIKDAIALNIETALSQIQAQTDSTKRAQITKAILDPESAIKSLIQGAGLSREEITALKAVYPMAMAQMHALAELKAANDPHSRDPRLRKLGVVQRQPEHVKLFQAMHKPQEQQGPRSTRSLGIGQQSQTRLQQLKV